MLSAHPGRQPEPFAARGGARDVGTGNANARPVRTRRGRCVQIDGAAVPRASACGADQLTTVQRLVSEASVLAATPALIAMVPVPRNAALKIGRLAVLSL